MAIKQQNNRVMNSGKKSKTILPEFSTLQKLALLENSLITRNIEGAEEILRKLKMDLSLGIIDNKSIAARSKFKKLLSYLVDIFRENLPMELIISDLNNKMTEEISNE